MTTAFSLALAEQAELHKKWITLSHKAAGIANAHPSTMNLQRAGEIDVLLRYWEGEPLKESASDRDILNFNLRILFSELWVGLVYEVFRILKGMTDTQEIKRGL